MATLALCRVSGISSIDCLSRLSVKLSLVSINTIYSSNHLMMEKPKKPTNYYAEFVSKGVKDYMKKQPGGATTDFFKMIAEDYKNLSKKQLEAMKTGYEKKMADYNLELAKWESMLDPNEKQALEDQEKMEKAHKKALKQKRKDRKLKVDLEKPKRPPGPFLLFCMDFSDPSLSVTEMTKKLGQEWSNLPDKKKKVYENKYLQATENYKMELNKWEMKMIEMGNESLVRVSTQQALKRAGKE